MKKLFLIAAVILMAGFANGQTLQKGSFFGFHVLTIKLDPNVTLNQFLDFYKTKMVPAYEKNYQGNCYLVKGIRGESEGCYGMIAVWKTEADRNKFFKEDGSDSDLGKAVEETMKPVYDELAKLGIVTSKYTDWLVQ
jgi:nicotinic acid phosphoribosyltransferase